MGTEPFKPKWMRILTACVYYIIPVCYRRFVWIDWNIYQGIIQFFIEFGLWSPCVCLSLIILLQYQGHPPMASDVPCNPASVFPLSLCGGNTIADNSALQQGLVSGAAGRSCQHLWSLLPALPCSSGWAFTHQGPHNPPPTV